MGQVLKLQGWAAHGGSDALGVLRGRLSAVAGNRERPTAMPFPRDPPGGFAKELRKAWRRPGAGFCRSLRLLCQVGATLSKWCARNVPTCACA